MNLDNLEEKDINIIESVSETVNKVASELSGKKYGDKKKLIDNVISVMSLAGGSGATTIVANMAYKLTKEGLSVVVIDTNIMYPMQQNYLGVEQVYERKDLVNYLSGSCVLGKCLSYKKDYSVIVANNRNIIDYVNTDSDEAANNLSEAFDALSRLFDVVLIDCSGKIESEIVNISLYRSDIIYAVMDENVECLSNIQRFRNNFEATGIPTAKMKFIMNKRTDVFYNPKSLKKFNIELMDIIPFDTSVIESGLRGEIYVKDGVSVSKNAKEIVLAYNRLTSKILIDGGYRDGL